MYNGLSTPGRLSKIVVICFMVKGTGEFVVFRRQIFWKLVDYFEMKINKRSIQLVKRKQISRKHTEENTYRRKIGNG